MQAIVFQNIKREYFPWPVAIYFGGILRITSPWAATTSSPLPNQSLKDVGCMVLGVSSLPTPLIIVVFFFWMTVRSFLFSLFPALDGWLLI